MTSLYKKHGSTLLVASIYLLIIAFALVCAMDLI